MHKFQIPMMGFRRPVIKLYGENALIDTGAIVPVISVPVELMKLAWSATLIKEGVEIGGIGGQSQGDIYALKNFCVGDLVFDKIEVFVPHIPDTQFKYLLSATMFHNTKYSFDVQNTDNQIFTVQVPENEPLHRVFEVKDLEGKLYIQVNGELLKDEFAKIVNLDNYTQTDVSSLDVESR